MGLPHVDGASSVAAVVDNSVGPNSMPSLREVSVASTVARLSCIK